MEFADRRTESIPSLLQDVIGHLVGSQVLTVKPDACIIDFYNEVANYSNFLWTAKNLHYAKHSYFCCLYL